MISYEKARAILLDAAAGYAAGYKAKTEIISLERCIGAICAENIIAPLDVQPFDNSAMDGFAVRLCDLQDNGGVLEITSLIAAGDAVPEEEIQAGRCIEIMTGAPVPPGTEAVIPVELAKVQGDKVHFKARPRKRANIRRAGEDFKKNMKVLNAGQRIEPQHIMPLATLGIAKIKTYQKPQAAFLATGRELVDNLSAELQSGQIYNSNRPYGVAALSAMNVDCVEDRTIADDPEIFDTYLQEFMEQNLDLIVSSGGVSAGKFDFVRKGLEKIGAEILFHKVKIKPGKPNLFARLPNGMLYFGLPGNPVATAAGLRFFVEPCVRVMIGMEQEKPVKAKLATPFKKRGGLKIFLKAHVESSKEGSLSVDLLEGQASFMVSPFLNMNCWAVAPEGVEEMKAGDIVDIYSLYPHAGFL